MLQPMRLFVWFMAQGARQGEVRLAANAVLMQFISVSAYFLDGLAFAAEALVGRAIGAGRLTAQQAARRQQPAHGATEPRVDLGQACRCIGRWGHARIVAASTRGGRGKTPRPGVSRWRGRR